MNRNRDNNDVLYVHIYMKLVAQLSELMSVGNETQIDAFSISMTRG